MSWTENSNKCRVTSAVNQDHVYALDTVRAGLTATIFLCHCSYILPDRLNHYIGWLTGYALELFFIISGFLAVLSNDKNQAISTGKFMLKKLAKIWPLHFLMYLATFFLQLFQSAFNISIRDTVKQTFVNLCLLQSWTPNETYVYSYNGVTWFLSSLFFCYLLTPFAIKMLRRGSRERMAFLLFLSLMLRFLYKAYFNHFIGVGGFCYVNVFPPYRFFEYFVGMVLGKIYMNTGNRLKSNGVQVSGFVLFFLAFFICLWSETIGTVDSLFICIELFMLYTLVFYEGVFDWAAKCRVIRFVSGISLPVFLVHQVVIKYVYHFFGVWGIDVQKCSAITFLLIAILTASLCTVYGKCNSTFRYRKKKR